MKHWTIALSLMLIHLSVWTAKPTENSPPPDAPPFDGIKIRPVGLAQLGSNVAIGVFGSFGAAITNALAKDPDSTRKAVKLYLNGIHMAGLDPEFLGPEAFSSGSTNKPVVVLQFTLERDANDEANRKAWDKLLSKLPFGATILHAGVGLNNDLVHLAGEKEFTFEVRPTWFIFAITVCGLGLLIMIMGWMIHTPMLRENGPGTAYSLGKTQMAFWGTVVALCFLGVWIVSTRMERIPLPVLTLLGISGATGLSSMLIGSNKRAAAGNDVQTLKEARDKKLNEQALLEQEKKSLEQEQQTVGAAFLPEQIQRLATVKLALVSLSNDLAERNREIASREQEIAVVPSDGKWWRDIVSDANGLSFHRCQVALWTVILGIVFIVAVVSTFSMPEFDQTLLILMGISNGTYLGFKTQEKTG